MVSPAVWDLLLSAKHLFVGASRVRSRRNKPRVDLVDARLAVFPQHVVDRLQHHVVYPIAAGFHRDPLQHARHLAANVQACLGTRAADLVCLYAFQDGSCFLKRPGWHWALRVVIFGISSAMLGRRTSSGSRRYALLTFTARALSIHVTA
jgi:hypothetical protein